MAVPCPHMKGPQVGGGGSEKILPPLRSLSHVTLQHDNLGLLKLHPSKPVAPCFYVDCVQSQVCHRSPGDPRST